MEDHDLLVLGGGTGNIVASAAAEEGVDVGLVERDRLGGTCLNRGCNPSKKLIHRADVIETIQTANSIGIETTIDTVAFEEIITDVTETITDLAEAKAERAREHENISLYQTEAEFVDERTVEVSNEREITGDTIVLAGGSRPLVPPIDGTDKVDFLTSADALYLDEQPESLTIVGGGYIAVEMGHLFGSLGTDVTIIGRADVLADREDREIAKRLTEAYEERYDLRLGHEATAIAEDGDRVVVTAENNEGEETEFESEEILLATGRQPNSDGWNVETAGIMTDDAGFVETDDYLETSVDGIWAMGDIAGNYMFKHSGDKEAEYVIKNAVRGNHEKVEYPGMAHAIFGSPQVGALGKTESEAEKAGIDYEIGRYFYDDTALGAALASDVGFAKAIVAGEEVVGLHVVGPQASILVHEVSTAVAAGADPATIANTIHVHPALSEVVQGAFRDVCEVAPSGI